MSQYLQFIGRTIIVAAIAASMLMISTACTSSPKVQDREVGTSVGKEVGTVIYEYKSKPISHIPMSRLKQKAVNDIERAAHLMDEDRVFLIQVAYKESGLRYNAKAPTSSATGLFQFIDSTWRTIVNKYGDKYDIKMSDRTNAYKSSIAMALLVKENRRGLTKLLKREPTFKELYLAHFAGMTKAAKLIKANKKAPITTVLSRAEVNANKFLRGLTVGEAIDKLTKGIDNA